MWPVSAKFLAAARDGSGTVVNRADILVGGRVEDVVRIASGTVTIDRANAVRRRCDVTLAEPTKLPIVTDSRLAPFGAEIRIWSGIDFGDGSEPELVPLITAPIQRSNANLSTRITRITADDRSRRVVQAKLEDDYPITAGTNYVTAIRALIDAAGIAGVEYLHSSTTFVTPALVVPLNADRWERVIEMAKACGMETWWDGLGRHVLRPVPSTVAATPVWEVTAGVADTRGVLIDGDIDLDRSDTANRIVGTGGNSSTGARWRSVATDDDPASPSYYHGDFGHQPDTIDVPDAASQAAVDAATAAELERRRGVVSSFSLQTTPMRALEDGDIVAVKRPADGIDRVDIIDRIVHDLGVGAMQLGTRVTRVAA